MAILGVSTAAILAATACGATEDKAAQDTRLAPPASYTKEITDEFVRADGRYWCGINYDDRTVAVSTANTNGEAYGMKLKLTKSGKELAAEASYDTNVFVKAFIVGDTEWSAVHRASSAGSAARHQVRIRSRGFPRCQRIQLGIRLPTPCRRPINTPSTPGRSRS